MDDVISSVPAGGVTAPFTDDEVASLNAYQTSGVMHEFTCRRSSRHPVLVATTVGWHCTNCRYTQTWAWEWMADGTWQDMGLPAS